jgi:DNA-binding transcriptional LysR family regulator
MQEPDWTLIRSFLTVVEQGTLSGAARVLGKSQPTLGRHIALLEEQLDAVLFDRVAEGYALTIKGQELMDSAKGMAKYADSFLRRAQGFAERIGGPVRITVNDVLGVKILPKTLAKIHQDYPEIRIELLVSNNVSNLLKREADIAVRMIRPTQADLVARKVGEIEVGFYGHESYFETHDMPKSIRDIKGQKLVGFDQDNSTIVGARAYGVELTPDDFSFRSDNMLAQYRAIAYGMGVGIVHKGYAEQLSGFVEVQLDIDIPPVEIWLACHRDVRHNRAIRFVMDQLAAALKNPFDI